MTRYELLKNNENVMFSFIKNGILSYKIIRDIEIFEQFNDLDLINKDAKYMYLGEVFELTPNRIEQIVYQMERIIN
jgi:hypothetical protein